MEKSKLNKTITKKEIFLYKEDLIKKIVLNANNFNDLINKVICDDNINIFNKIPNESINIIIADPPYIIPKKFNKTLISFKSDEDFINKNKEWIKECYRVLKPDGTFYVCSDYKTTPLIYQLLINSGFIIKNRITWKRDKGRGSDRNYKNVIEDIYFAVKSDNYYFNPIKVTRKVKAPYKNLDNTNRDWYIDEEGNNVRETYLSNIWEDIVIPFWSMPENTEHPTQKPEKLIERLLLTSSKENDIVLDPFLGSGTTAVVSKKLNRKFIGIEKDIDYCLISQYRLEKGL